MIPFSIDLLLLFVLIIISFMTKSLLAERIILVLICMPLLYIFFESLYRRTTIGEEKLRIEKFLRKKEVPWKEVINVDIMTVGKKAYLLLTAKKGFHILPNSHENFVSLVRDIAGRVENENVEERVSAFIEKPVRRTADVVASWVAAVLLMVVIFLKLTISAP